jgi:hypothetical protein
VRFLTLRSKALRWLLAGLLWACPVAGCATRAAAPPAGPSEAEIDEARGGGRAGLSPKALPPDPDQVLVGKLLVLDKPAPERLPLGYQQALLKQHQDQVRRTKKGWVLHLFAHAHAGEGQLERARLEVRPGDVALNLEDPPIYYEPLNLLQHEVRMARTVVLRKDPAYKAGTSLRLVVVVTGATPLKIAETVITLR